MNQPKLKRVVIYIGACLFVYSAIFVLIIDDALDSPTFSGRLRRALSLENGSIVTEVSASGVTYQYNTNLDPAFVMGKGWADATILDDGTYLIFTDDHGKTNHCETLSNEKDKIKRIHFYAGSCRFFDEKFGNRMAKIYGIKMAANAMRIPSYFTCGMDRGEAPHGGAFLMDFNNGIVGPPPKGEDGIELTVEQVCADCSNKLCTWNSLYLGRARDIMKSDWEFLADKSPLPASDHDDAVIHLQLGDALVARSGQNEYKGVFPHQTYINLINQAQQERGQIETIGVVTAPFEGSLLNPGYDSGSTARSELVAMDLINALQKSFPQARVRLHNSPGETIIDSMVRVVEARKVAICGCSSLCPSPMFATKGIAFVHNPKHNRNIWVRHAAELDNNYRLFNAPMLNMVIIAKIHDAALLAWMRTQSPDVGNIDITNHPLIRAAPEENCKGPSIGSSPTHGLVGSTNQVTSRALFDAIRVDAAGHVIWNNMVTFLLEKTVASGYSISSPDYPHSAEDVTLALQQTGLDVSKSKVAVVSHARSPWVEYLVRSFGAYSVASIDYAQPIVCGIDWIKPKSVTVFASEVDTYDLLVSYTGVEYFGLGGGGPNPLNQEGDVEMVRHMYKALRPGGFLLLAVPTSEEAKIVGNFYRVYNSEALVQLLKKRFKLISHVWDGQVLGGWSEDNENSKLFPHPSKLKIFDWQHRHIMILQKKLG